MTHTCNVFDIHVNGSVRNSAAQMAGGNIEKAEMMLFYPALEGSRDCAQYPGGLSRRLRVLEPQATGQMSDQLVRLTGRRRRRRLQAPPDRRVPHARRARHVEKAIA